MRLRTFLLEASIPGTKVKAGGLPFVIEDGIVHFLLMVPSDPAYGGDRPQISKGHINKGEDFIKAGLRECEEEMGVTDHNRGKIVGVVSETVTGLDLTYELKIVVFPIKDRKHLVKTDKETAKIVWVNENELNKVRRSHLGLLQKALKLIKS